MLHLRVLGCFWLDSIWSLQCGFAACLAFGLMGEKCIVFRFGNHNICFMLGIKFSASSTVQERSRCKNNFAKQIDLLRS